MSRFISKHMANIDPYTPGEHAEVKIKLNQNEFPYPASPKVIEAIAAIDPMKYALYASPTNDELRETIADYYGINPEQVYVGNGSDEVLAITFMTFFDAGDEVCYPDTTYSFYDVYADLYKLKKNVVDLDENMILSLDDYKDKKGNVVIANPNAPSGLALSISEIERFAKENPDRLIVVDEAYVDFADDSALRLIEKYDNILVIHTLSKSRALAGIRIGIAFGNKALIEAMEIARFSFHPFNVTLLSGVAAKAAFEDDEYFKNTVGMLIATRDRMIQEFRKRGFDCNDTKTNFILIKKEGMNAKKLHQSLKEKSILARYFNTDRLKNYVRISVGTDEQMDMLVKAIDEILEEENASS